MTTPVPVPFDPELAVVLEEISAYVNPGLAPDAIPAFRETLGPVPSNADLSRGGAFTVTERLVPGPAGAPPVPLLTCLPAGATAPTAAICYLHGGGMISGTSRTGLLPMVENAQQAGAAVISVDYRLAPETPYPGPVEDCYAALAWTAGHAADLNLDPGKLVVAGNSAGGGLAAAVALLARDRGGPALAGQLLSSPMLDDRNESPSSWQMAGLGVWDRTANETGWGALLGASRGGPGVSPYAAPARATDLSGLPPAFIDVGSAETFRDEDVSYANRILQAGGQAELHVWAGGCHGFAGVAPQAAVSRNATEAKRRWLRRILLA